MRAAYTGAFCVSALHTRCILSSSHGTRGAKTPKSNWDGSSVLSHSNQDVAIGTSANVSSVMASHSQALCQ